MTPNGFFADKRPDVNTAKTGELPANGLITVSKQPPVSVQTVKTNDKGYTRQIR